MATGKSIVQQIRLEGGQAIKTQLESIGAAGKKAFADLQAVVQSNRAFGNIGAAIDSVKAKAAQMGAAGQKLGNDLGELGSRARSTASTIALIAGGTTAAVAGFALFVKRGGEVVDTLEKISAELGITTKEFENTRDAAEQAGVKEEELTRAFRAIKVAQGEVQKSSDAAAKKQRDLTRQYTDGTLSSEAYLKAKAKLVRETNDESDAFSRLGVEALNADGSVRDLIPLTDDIADALNGIADGTERSNRAFDLLGTRSARTLNFFGQGSDAIRKAREEAERTAPALTTLQKGALSLADDAFDKMKRSLDSVTNAFRATFSPAIANVFNSITEAVVRNRTAFLEYASTVASKVRPIVDDVIAAIEGRDKDVKNTFILKARDAMIELGTATVNVVNNIILPALKGFIAALDTVAKAINAVFGTNLSGSQIAIALVIVKVLGLFGLLTGAVKVAVSAIGLLIATFGAMPIAIAAVGAAIGFFLVKGLQAVPWGAFVTAATNAWTMIQNGVTAVGTFIANAFNSAATAVSDAWNTSVQFVMDIWNGVVAFFVGIGTTIAGAANTAATAVSDAFNTAVQFVTGLFNSLWSKVTDIFTAIINRARAVATAVRNAVSGGSSGSGDQQGFAGGGVVRGPGTGTSDSILARLSNGEFINTARAVRYWGEDVFRALNNFQNPFAGFNAGGLVSALASVAPRGIPRFAEGGLVGAVSGGGSRTPINLHFPERTIGPVMADQEVLHALYREAIRKGRKSAGTKPSFYGA